MSHPGVEELSMGHQHAATLDEATPSGANDASLLARRSTRSATVCQVLHSLTVGGAEVLAARLARQLQDEFRFVFVCLDERGPLGAQLSGEGFPVKVLNRSPGLSLHCIRGLTDFVSQERVDLLHAHQYTPFFYSALCRVVGRSLPVLFTEHGRHHPDQPSGKRRLANRLLLRSRDRVVAVGEAVREALIQKEGISGRRVEVIYNGIPLDQFDHRLDSAERGAIRRELGVEPDDLVLIQVARLDYLKDHATAIRMLERVAQRVSNVRLVLVGEGPEREAIEAMVRQRGLSGNVRFLGLRADVPRLLAVADIALLTSLSEGIPLTLIEAMAAQLPVVATRAGGIPEVVVEGQTGLLADVGDDAALAAHIMRSLKEPELFRAMGLNGKARAVARFSEPQMHADYRRVYGEMTRT